MADPEPSLTMACGFSTTPSTDISLQPLATKALSTPSALPSCDPTASTVTHSSVTAGPSTANVLPLFLPTPEDTDALSVLTDMDNYDLEDTEMEDDSDIPMIDPDDDSPTEDEDEDEDDVDGFSDDGDLKDKGKKPIRAPRGKAAVLQAGPSKKGRRLQLHARALECIINDDNISKTTDNRKLGGLKWKKAQSCLIQSIVQRLGRMCNYKARHLRRSKNPDGAIRPLRKLTPATFKHEMKRREKFMLVNGPVHVVRLLILFGKYVTHLLLGRTITACTKTAEDVYGRGEGA
jgi:hypothetical protein